VCPFPADFGGPVRAVDQPKTAEIAAAKAVKNFRNLGEQALFAVERKPRKAG
jgi:hypothetical protein